MIVPYATNHYHDHGHRQNQEKSGPTEWLASYSCLGQDSGQSGHAESEILQDDEQDEIQQEWQRKIAAKDNKIGPPHARNMRERFGKREGQHDKTINDNEKNLERSLGNQLLNSKTSIDNERRAE